MISPSAVEAGLSRLLTIVAIVVVSASPALAKSPKAPAVAPPFTLPAQSDSVALDSLRGKVVLLDFWASWCVPCRKSFPWMNTMNERYGKRGLVIVAVNLDKTRDDAMAFLQSVPATFTVAFDPAGKTAESYHVKAMPMSYVISPDGKILATHAGFDPKHTSSLETTIAGALPQ